MGNIGWAWILAWLGHLILAAMGLWGLIVICIHVGCLAALIQGTERVMTVLAIAFVSQLTASALVVTAFDNGGDGADIKRRITIVWLACAVPVIVFLVGSFVRQARN